MERTVTTLNELFRKHVMPRVEHWFTQGIQWHMDEQLGALVIDVRDFSARAMTQLRTVIRQTLGSFGIAARPRRRKTELHIAFQTA